MEPIRLKIRLKKQAEKELIKMVNNGDTVEALLIQVKKIRDLEKAIGRLKNAVAK